MDYQEILKDSEGSVICATDILAKRAWETYKQRIGGKAFNGDPLPTWDELVADEGKKDIVAAWKLAAFEVVRTYMLAQLTGVIDSGNAGCMPNGNIVDRRIHPEAIPLHPYAPKKDE